MAEGTISVIPQEKETNIERHSISLVPQEMMSKGGDIISNSIPVTQQEFEPNGDEIGKNCIPAVQKEIESDSIPMIPQEVGSIADESDDISTKSISVIGQEVESNDDQSHNVSTKSISMIPQEMDLEGRDRGRNSFPETSQELELGGEDIRRSFIGKIDPADIQTNSIAVIRQEMELNVGDPRRNSIAGIPQEMEYEGSDIRRNSIIVIPNGIEATGADVRRRSIARSIQSRYLRASTGSCHDFCKYGSKKGCDNENFEASPSADRKRTSAVNSKPSPGSIVREKRVISVTKKGTTFPKKVSLQEVSSPFKEVDVPMEPQFEPSSKVKSTGEPSLDSEAQILNKSFVTEEKVASVMEKGTVRLGKEIDVTMEESMDLEEEAKQLEPSSFPGSVRSLRNSKVISTISTPRPSPGSATNQKPKEMESSTEDFIHSKMKPEQPKTSSLAGPMQSMRNSKVVSRTSSKPVKDFETQKLNSSAVMEKKVTTVKKKGTASSHNRDIGIRKGKEAPDCSSNISIRDYNGRASLPGEKQTTGLQVVSLSSNFNKRDSNMNTGSSYNLKGLSHVEDQNDPEKFEPQPPSDKDMPEKILYVVELSTENSTMESNLNDASVPKPSPSSAQSAVEGGSKSLKHARKGIDRTGSAPSYEKKNLKRVNKAESRSAGPLDQDNKGLRRTQLGTQSSLSRSTSSLSLSISSPKSTKHEENDSNSQHGSKTVKPIGQSKVQHKTTPRKSPIVGSGNRSVPQKLAFRRGRVIEPQPENNTPRRLKFRRVRLAVEVQNSKGSITSGSIERKEVDDSQSSTSSSIIKRGTNLRKEVLNRQINGDGIKRASIVKREVGDRQPNGAFIKRGIIGRKEVDDDQINSAQVKSGKVVLRHQEQVNASQRKSLRSKGVSCGLLNGIRSSQEKVVLRHQDADGKKDDQKSFNNVIEETASKLAETRKSKVKALVGAFETVISLQDRRAATVADAC